MKKFTITVQAESSTHNTEALEKLLAKLAKTSSKNKDSTNTELEALYCFCQKSLPMDISIFSQQRVTGWSAGVLCLLPLLLSSDTYSIPKRTYGGARETERVKVSERALGSLRKIVSFNSLELNRLIVRGGVIKALLSMRPINHYYSKSRFNDGAINLLIDLAKQKENRESILLTGGLKRLIDELPAGVDNQARQRYSNRENQLILGWSSSLLNLLKEFSTDEACQSLLVSSGKVPHMIDVLRARISLCFKRINCGHDMGKFHYNDSASHAEIFSEIFRSLSSNVDIQKQILVRAPGFPNYLLGRLKELRCCIEQEASLPLRQSLAGMLENLVSEEGFLEVMASNNGGILILKNILTAEHDDEVLMSIIRVVKALSYHKGFQSKWFEVGYNYASHQENRSMPSSDSPLNKTYFHWAKNHDMKFWSPVTVFLSIHPARVFASEAIQVIVRFSESPLGRKHLLTERKAIRFLVDKLLADNEFIAEKSIIALNNLASSEGGHQAIYDIVGAEFVAPFAIALLNYSNERESRLNRKVRYCIMQAVKCLSARNLHHSVLVDNDLIEVLSSSLSMRGISSIHHVHETAIHTLENICRRSGRDYPLNTRMNTVNRFIRALADKSERSRFEMASAVEQFLMKLPVAEQRDLSGNASFDALKFRINTNRVIKILVNMLYDPRKNIKEHALISLKKILSSGDHVEIKQRYFVSVMGVAPITHLVSHEDNKISAKAVSILNLVSENCIESRYAIRSAGGISRLKKLLEQAGVNPSSINGIQKEIVGILVKLAMIRDYHKEITDAGWVDLLMARVRKMASTPQQGDLEVVIALKYLACNQSISDKVYANDKFAPWVKLCKNKDTELRRHARGVIWLLLLATNPKALKGDCASIWKKVGHVDLSGIQLSREHVDILFEFIQNCTSIKSLCLRDIALDYGQSLLLLKAVSNNTSLTDMDVRSAGLKRNIISALRCIMQRNSGGSKFYLQSEGDTSRSFPLFIGATTTQALASYDVPAGIDEDFRCGICKKIMLNPVLAADGESYERELIENWLSENDTSPVTGKVLDHKSFISDKFLRKHVELFLAAHPVLMGVDEVYFNDRLTNDVMVAVSGNNIDEVRRLVKLDARLFSRDFSDEGKLTLFGFVLNLQDNPKPELLQTVIDEMGHRFWELPKISENQGQAYFQTVMNNYGTEGARIIKNKLNYSKEYIQGVFKDSVTQGALTQVGICLDLGADIEAQGFSGSRALHWAVVHDNLDLVRLLVSRGADKYALNPKKQTAFYIAAALKKVDMIPILLPSQSESKADYLNILCTSHKRSALHLMLDRLRTEQKGPSFSILEMLVNAGANLEIPNLNTECRGDTALLQTIRLGHREAFELILTGGPVPANMSAVTDHSGKQDALHLAIARRQSEFVDRLLENGADKESTVLDTGDTAILHAIRQNNVEIFSALMTAKPNPSLESKDLKGNTALHLAFSLKYYNLIPALVSAGANLEAVDDKGNTGVLCAVASNQFNLVWIMLTHAQSPANINAMNANKDTALHIVARMGDSANEKKLAACLLEEGISAFVHNNVGKKAEDLAFQCGNNTLAGFIAEKIIDLKVRQQSPRRVSYLQPASTKPVPMRRMAISPIVKYDEHEFEDTNLQRLGGSSFCAGVYKRKDGRLYVGTSNNIATEDRSEVHACAGKIALDIYGYFGVPVPKAIIARMPIIFPEGLSAKDILEIDNDRTHTIYLMSEIISGFHAFSEVPKFSGGYKFCTTIPGHDGMLEVVNFGRMLAVAKFLNDPDVLGASASNFVCQVTGGKVHCIKIDAGEAFNTNDALQVGLRNIRFATQGDYTTLKFDDLPTSVKDEFIDTIARFTRTSIRVLTNFFVRAGAENMLVYGSDRNLSAMPKILMARQQLFKDAYAAELSFIKPLPQGMPMLHRNQVKDSDVMATFKSKQSTLMQGAKSLSASSHTEAMQHTIHRDELTYSESDLIGKGSFSTVYSGHYRGVEVAIKKLVRQGLSMDATVELRQEAAMMQKLNHRNLMKLYGLCVDPGEYSLVFELLHITLFDWLNDKSNDIPWSFRYGIAHDIAEGLRYLDEKKIVHRDIKSSNILLHQSDEQVVAKIGDFGLATVKKETAASTAVSNATHSQSSAHLTGTVLYMAPELFKRRAKATPGSDMYSAGVTMNELASREPPFAGEEQVHDGLIIAWVRDGERPEVPEDTPAEFKALINECWAQTPSKRPRASEVCGRLLAMKQADHTSDEAALLISPTNFSTFRL